MGFSHESALAALVASSNNILRAVQILTATSAEQRIRRQSSIGESKNEYSPSRVSIFSSSDEDSGEDPDDEEEELMLMTAQKEDHFLSVVCDLEGITKVIWAVDARDLAPWFGRSYDYQLGSVVFYISNIVASKYIIIHDTNVNIDLRFFDGQIEEAEAAAYGIHVSYDGSTSSISLHRRRDVAHARARSANESLRQSGGEWKNTFESMGPSSSLGDSMLSIREAFEFQLHDISDRVTVARASGVSERKILNFSREAFKYITCVLDISLIRLRRLVPDRPGSWPEPEEWASVKRRAKVEGWDHVAWSEWLESVFAHEPGRVIRQRSTGSFRRGRVNRIVRQRST
jgi:hypothetical protein